MPRFYSITSASNPLLKDVRRAIARGSLTSDGLCAAESIHLLREALASSARVLTVLASETARSSVEMLFDGVAASSSGGVHVAILPPKIFDSVSGTEASQGVIALVEPPRWSLDQLFHSAPLTVVLDEVQDPGNAGTVARAAEAFGASGVLFVKGSASPYNPKTLRASAGSLFRVPFVPAVEPAIARAALVRNRLAIYAGTPCGSGWAPMTIREADFRVPCALVIGNEGRGVSHAFRSEAIGVAIPTVGVESLNASVAAAILLYEAHRQRTFHT